ncbi:MAG: hypothetical protein K2K44_08040 [Oscillospiraceae bacterium]|nr:hypothetical protein [Oscillospiraceae bacterium]
MQTKFNSGFSLRNSFSFGRRSSISLRNAYRNSLKTSSTKSNSLTSSIGGTSIFKGAALAGGRRSSKYTLSSNSLSDIKIIGNNVLPSANLVSKCENKAVDNFKVINKAQNSLNDSIPKWLEEAGIPKDVKFEFDYNIDTQKAEVTKISDENYRESVEAVINKKMGNETLYTAYASRIMNGYISSAYYSSAAKSLETCFGQDINDLSLDRNGNIKGANANLQRALKASKNGREYTSISSRKFPAEDIEGVLKRLLSDKNITPNVSHMGYDGRSVYTNDGKFKLGKDFNTSMFKENRYVMRGAVALYGNNSYDTWLENEKLFL